MGLFNNWPAIRRIVQLVIIQLFCWLACSVSFCFAQLDISEGVTGSVNFPSALAITCVGNLAVFVTTLIRGRIDLEIGARDALSILLGRKLMVISDPIDGYALSSTGGNVDVVMLSSGRPNSSVREFMKSNAPIVDSVLLQFFLLKDSRLIVRKCPHGDACRCIVFWTSEEIRVMLVRRMPRTLKLLSDLALCLLPCLTCLTYGCHGCRGVLLYTEEDDKLREGNSIVQSDGKPHVVCGILEDDHSISTGEPFCICIPLNGSKSDKWTELLIRSKDLKMRKAEE